MILPWLIVILLASGLLAWSAGRWSPLLARLIALFGTLAVLGIAVGLWVHYAGTSLIGNRGWLLDFTVPWVAPLGIHVHLALDGLSLLLVTLTGFIGALAVLASWRGVTARVGFFHFNLLWTLAGITGVFLALDLFLFYFFWEVMLIPLYFLIDLWGYERRHYAAVKFFIFTQTGGLFLLLSILGLYFLHYAQRQVYTFDYFALLDTAVPTSLALWLMLGFFIAFIVKLPAVPVHTWLPDAHTQAPTAGSVLLAGLVLKVGAYGLLRFTVPLFPQAALAFAPVAMALAVAGILYGAVLAFGQRDLKRLVAYTSVSHMGFVLLGIFAWNEIALLGAVIVVIAHGISTGALFIVVGALNERLHTRDMDRMGGLWALAPKLGGTTLFFALASLGLPGLANFVGEFLVLIGVFRVAPVFAALATLGLILSAVYSLWLVQRVFFGRPPEGLAMPDLTARELAMLAPAIAVVVWLGLMPQTVLETATPAVRGLLRQVRPAIVRTASPTPPAEGGDHAP